MADQKAYEHNPEHKHDEEKPEDTLPPSTSTLEEAGAARKRIKLEIPAERITGKMAEAPGYLVGGKTGTAEKVSGKSYNTHSLMSSFAGVFPMNDPRYFVMISIDEPHGNSTSHGYATAGWVAAPGVSRTVERMASLVGIAPIDEDSPDVRRALAITLPPAPGRKFASN